MVVASQFKAPHELVVPAVQVPVLALQVPAVVCMNDIPLPLHEAAPHETGAGAGGQVPVPLHVVAATDEFPMHEAARQTFPDFWAQAPLAAHLPVVAPGALTSFPQPIAVVSGTHSGSTVPGVTEVQVPAEPGRLQAWQAPAQLLLQQTPSTLQTGADGSQSDETLHMAPAACFVPHL
jgi:hypothetical protein